MQRREKGRAGEEAAARYLIENNHEILQKNYFTKYGEIDIIFKDGDALVFAEVKLRTGSRYGSPAESVTATKIKKISLSAMQYLYNNSLMDANCRFDVIEINGNDMHLRHIKNAFEAVLE